MEQKAGSTVLDALRKQTQGMLSDKMKNLKKVTVASNSPEGLKAGLDKAKEIVTNKNGSDLTKSPSGEIFGKSKGQEMKPADEKEIEGLDESPEEEASETPEFEAGEQEEMGEEECKTPEEVDRKIDELMALKKQLLAKK